MAKQTCTMQVAVAVLTVGMYASADVADVTFTETETRQFAPGDAYGSLVNAASSGEVTLASSGAAVEADAISVTNFDATANGAATVFDGGWWDFGNPSANNFMTSSSEFSDRSVLLDNGAVVTNAGSVHVAGTGGANNRLRLTGASSFFAGYISLGSSKSAGQKSKVTVDGGSLLQVSGELSLSTGEKWRGEREQTGNSLTVSGEGSRLVVGGQTSLGRNRDSGGDAQIMRFGGNTFTVADGASATLGALNVDTGGLYGGESNRVVFSKNAHVTMTSLRFAIAGAKGGRGGNLLEILDGAVVTNTGTMMFGMANVAKELGNRIVVSNATFYTKLLDYSNRGKLMIWGNGNSFVVSGANAELNIDDVIKGFFKDKGSSFVVENGATLNSPSSSYCYTEAASNNTVLVTTGATLNFPDGVNTVGQVNAGRTDSAFNKLVVESGATISTASAKNINIYGTGCELTVDDGSVDCGGNVHVGSTESYDTNCLVKVCGTHPKMTIAKSLDVKNGSCLRFELPATGYDMNAATGENPLLDVGATAGNGIYLDETSRLEFAGAEELLAYHKQTKERRDYVLAQAESIGISAEQIAAASAGLPEGMTLTNTGTKLVLRVSPQRPLIIIVR